MKKLFLIFFLTCYFAAKGQYSTAQAHSHNDYEQERPLFQALDAQFGSLEADVFLRNDTLYVAHEWHEVRPDRTLSTLYIAPLVARLTATDGRVYEEAGKTLQLLIDLKTEAYSTLDALVRLLAPHRDLLYPKGSVKIVISGNTPLPDDFKHYPDFIRFDGRPTIVYTEQQLERVGLISHSFRNYSQWDGSGDLMEKDREALRRVVGAAHAKGKPFRFWATPDVPAAWAILQELQVDYINTDRIEALAAFLNGS